ncbi:MAG: hypothetical protein ABSE47_10430 [Acidimicrobiales bacterium]|jgi:hypothetical protein
MALQRQDVDRVLDPGFVEGLSDAPVGELRSKRAECRRVEDLVSYLRRVVQGQVDLVVAEMELRLGGGSGDHQHQLVEDLPSILARAHPHTAVLPEAGVARQLTSRLAMPAVTEVFAEEAGLAPEEIAAVISPELAETTFKGGMLPGANLETFADGELTALLEHLRRHEAILSAERKVLHERIDQLQAVVVERYKSGAAHADTLLQDHNAVIGSNDRGDESP